MDMRMAKQSIGWLVLAPCLLFLGCASPGQPTAQVTQYGGTLDTRSSDGAIRWAQGQGCRGRLSGQGCQRNPPDRGRPEGDAANVSFQAATVSSSWNGRPSRM